MTCVGETGLHKIGLTGKSAALQSMGSEISQVSCGTSIGLGSAAMRVYNTVSGNGEGVQLTLCPSGQYLP